MDQNEKNRIPLKDETLDEVNGGAAAPPALEEAEESKPDWPEASDTAHRTDRANPRFIF